MSFVIAAALIASQGITLHDAPTPDASGLAAEYGSGVCRISVFAKDSDGERIRAEFARRLRDGNFSIALKGYFIRKHRDKDVNENHPVTVSFDSAASAPSRSGGYDLGGFRESVWGGWGPGAASDATYGQLAGASSFTVSMDGNSFGPFTVSKKGAIHAALESCEVENS